MEGAHGALDQKAIAVAQVLPLLNHATPWVYTCVLSCYISMRALQTYEGHAWDVVPLSADWMTAMAPLVRDAQRAKDLASAAGEAGRAGSLIPQPLLSCGSPLSMLKGRVVDGGASGGSGGDDGRIGSG